MTASSGPADLLRMTAAQKRGEPQGIYSLCSANRFVLEAAMEQGLRDGSAVLIEATSNQVDQFGGYTGMTPAAFAVMVREVACARGLPSERLILGGDHLGPNAWRNENAAPAMAKARDLVAAYVSAGFAKIHLDASMPCADDANAGREHLPDEVVAARAADMCAAAEAAHRAGNTGMPAPLYVIGTEVPRPGGAQSAQAVVEVTAVADAERTMRVCEEAFAAKGLHDAWRRVIAVVVQPGVEFGDDTVSAYDRKHAAGLSGFIKRHPQLVYEAHSTDYQLAELLRQMVEDQFAILKVGPELTFAFREAVFALDAVEEEWLAVRSGAQPARVRAALERAMRARPVYWEKYHRGTEAETAFARRYSFSDRSRYYWVQPVVQDALNRLLANLTRTPPPLTLISQYLPRQYEAIRAGRLRNAPRDLITHKIGEITNKYARACWS